MAKRTEGGKTPPKNGAPPSRTAKRGGWHDTSHAPRSSSAPGEEAPFRCIHCGARVGLTVSGGRHRNHCPICLYSRHVDDTQPGDRASACKGAMAPIGRFERPNGEPVILHRCERCSFERYNRVAADDDWERYLALPTVPARHTSAPTGNVNNAG